MAKSKDTSAAANTTLEALAAKLDALADEATALGEDRLAKRIGNAAKGARSAAKQRTARLSKLGGLVEALKAKGLTAEQIVAQLTAGEGA